MSGEPIVLVGGGLAAATAATELRAQGYDGPLVLFSGEPHLPHERPPLSKGYLLGQDPLESAFVHDETWYDDHDVELLRGVRVESIDVSSHTLRAGDLELAWARLLLATGATPRRLASADAGGVPVHYLRTIDDATALREHLVDGARIAVVGAGWIGLEVACAARQRGAEVVVLEAMEQPLTNVLGLEVGGLFARLHREHGVDVRTGVRIEQIAQDSDGPAIRLGGGDTLAFDRLVVGIGVQPDVALATGAGLAVDNGILVDAGLRTSAPDVYAAGDVANVEHPVLGHRLRVEHWDTALKHGAVAATNLLGGDAVADQPPYFFSDQYALGLEYVGHPGSEGFDRVVVAGDVDGPVEECVLRVWWMRDDLVVAGMHVNDWDAIDRVRELVGTRPGDAALAST
jgi:3-phenylpropionate/trans-cinnamate dioxygenase ferredoxin reductase component